MTGIKSNTLVITPKTNMLTESQLIYALTQYSLAII